MRNKGRAKESSGRGSCLDCQQEPTRHDLTSGSDGFRPQFGLNSASIYPERGLGGLQGSLDDLYSLRFRSFFSNAGLLTGGPVRMKTYPLGGGLLGVAMEFPSVGLKSSLAARAQFSVKEAYHGQEVVCR
jgi:hypothetical protein